MESLLVIVVSISHKLAAAVASIERELAAIKAAGVEADTISDYHDRKKGNRFEEEVRRIAISLGHDVRARCDSKHDVVINGKKTECKRKDTDTISLCTTPTIGRSYGGYLAGDWEVLVLKNKGITYVIPAAVLMHDDGLRIKNHIDPKDYSEWVNRWDVFGASFVVVRECQQSLFWIENEGAKDGR